MSISKRTKACATSVVLLLCSVAGYIYCVKNTLPNEGEIGSMYTPKLLFGCLFVLSVLKLMQSVREDNTKEKIVIDRKKMVTGIGTIVLVGLYCLLFRPLGYLVTTFLYLVGQMALFHPAGKRRWGLILVIAVVTTAATYLIFVVGFQLMLPAGILKNMM